MQPAPISPFLGPLANQTSPSAQQPREQSSSTCPVRSRPLVACCTDVETTWSHPNAPHPKPSRPTAPTRTQKLAHPSVASLCAASHPNPSRRRPPVLTIVEEDEVLSEPCRCQLMPLSCWAKSSNTDRTEFPIGTRMITVDEDFCRQQPRCHSSSTVRFSRVHPAFLDLCRVPFLLILIVWLLTLFRIGTPSPWSPFRHRPSLHPTVVKTPTD